MNNPAIRGTRVGAGNSADSGSGARAEARTVNFYCANGHEMNPQFAATVADADIPELLDCTKCELMAGQDKENPPPDGKAEPYKTHLAYVKERRTEAEAEEILAEALAAIQERRAKLKAD